MAELTKKYIVDSDNNTVRCTNRETKSDAGGTTRTFDICLDFTGVSDLQIREWAAATVIIRVQNSLRKQGDDILKGYQDKGMLQVNVKTMGTALSDDQLMSAAKKLPKEKLALLLKAYMEENGDLV